MTRKLRLDPVSMERVAYPGGFHCDSGTRPEHASCFFLLSLRSLLDQLKKLQAMVTEIANKTSSGSTCVLVRRVTRDPFPGRDRTAGCVTQSLHLLSLCSRSLCSLSAFSWYLLCTPLMQGGVCPLSMLVRGLRTPSGVGCGRGLLLCGLLTSLCLLSVAPQASRPPQ